MARLVIDLNGFAGNARCLRDYCAGRGLSLLPVMKAAGFDAEIVRTAHDAGGDLPAAAHLAGARALHQALGKRVALLTMPPLSRADDVVALAERSYLAEPAVAAALAEAAERADMYHEMVLFVDLGDLREGCLPNCFAELLRTMGRLEHENFHVAGIASNFGCLHGLRPSRQTMDLIRELAAVFFKVLGRLPEVVSVGGSILLPWMASNALPPEVSELRLGEAMLLGHFQGEDVCVPGLTRDPVLLEGEVLEIARKPTSQDGAYGPNALGELGRPPDRGERLRALLDFGILDTKPWELSCRTPGVEYVGATSNYAIYDVEAARPRPKPGATLQFTLGYEALARAFHSRYLDRRIIDGNAGFA